MFYSGKSLKIILFSRHAFPCANFESNIWIVVQNGGTRAQDWLWI